MAFSIEYDQSLPYKQLPFIKGNCPALEISLRNGSFVWRGPGLLDSGSMHTVLSREYAEPLGIKEVESGERIQVSTFGGPAYLYQFEVEMSFELEGQSEYFPSPVCFSASRVGRNILGRIAIFSRLKLGFSESSERLYLGRESF